jgi:DNA-binding transcriptional LysR family regulator
LRVNVDPTFARLILAPHLGRFLKTHPGLSLEIAVRDRLGDPLAEGFDFAVRFGEPEPSTLIGRRLLQARVLTCASLITVPVNGRLVLNDAATQLGLCAAGCGVAQVFELGAESMLASGILVNLFPDWTDELFPLYALHPSKNLPPAKVRAFLDFIIEAVGFEV